MKKLCVILLICVLLAEYRRGTKAIGGVICPCSN